MWVTSFLRILANGGSSTQDFCTCAIDCRTFGVCHGAITRQPKNIDQNVLVHIKTCIVTGHGNRGYRDIIIGSESRISKRETGIEMPDHRDAIISTISIHVPVSSRIYTFEDCDWLPVFNRKMKIWYRFRFCRASCDRSIRIDPVRVFQIAGESSVLKYSGWYFGMCCTKFNHTTPGFKFFNFYWKY